MLDLEALCLNDARENFYMSFQKVMYLYFEGVPSRWVATDFDVAPSEECVTVLKNWIPALWQMPMEVPDEYVAKQFNLYMFTLNGKPHVKIIASSNAFVSDYHPKMSNLKENFTSR